MSSSNLGNILDQRGNQYGDYMAMSHVAQALKSVVSNHISQIGNRTVSPIHLESLDSILLKIARIANGNANNLDSWTDIAGYATLVVNAIQAAIQRQADAEVARQSADDQRAAAADAARAAEAVKVDDATAAAAAAHAQSVLNPEAATTGPVDTAPAAPVALPLASDYTPGADAPAGTDKPVPDPAAQPTDPSPEVDGSLTTFPAAAGVA